MTLDALFIFAKTSNTASVWTRIIREHGGLGESMQRQYGKHLKPYEIQSYMYQALPLAVIEYDPQRGRASTIWVTCVRRLIQRDRRAQTCVGAVRVPYNSKAYKCKEFEEGDILREHVDFRI